MKNIKQAKSVLSDYFGITLPQDLLISIIESNAELKYEVETGGIGDTEQRSDLVNAVIAATGIKTGKNFIGQVNQWPCYGDSEKYRNKFFALFAPALEALGGTIDLEAQ